MKIDCEKLGRLQRQHVAFNLIDVRAPSAYENGHIAGALNLPANIFSNKLPSTVSRKDAAIVIYDNNGESSDNLVSRAETMGYLNIVNLEGGYQEYLKNRGR